LNNLKKIISKIILFLLPLILVALFFEYQLKNRPFVSSYATKKYFFEKQLDSVEILILGSSQTFNGVNPSCFTNKTFNLANVSQTIYYDKRLTLQYLPKLTKLKTVVVSISYFSFFYQLFDIKENWRDYYYLQHFGIKYYQLNTFQLNNYSAMSVYQPLHCLKLAANNFVDVDAKKILLNGYLPKYSQELISDSSGNARVNVHNRENFLYRRNEIEKDLDDFVYQLKEKKIQVIFLTTPVNSSYSKFCDSKVMYNNKKIINALCNKYHCVYLDFFNDNRFKKEDFFDNDHLKNTGATKLSMILNDTLRKI